LALHSVAIATAAKTNARGSTGRKTSGYRSSPSRLSRFSPSLTLSARHAGRPLHWIVCAPGSSESLRTNLAWPSFLRSINLYRRAPSKETFSWPNESRINLASNQLPINAMMEVRNRPRAKYRSPQSTSQMRSGTPSDQCIASSRQSSTSSIRAIS